MALACALLSLLTTATWAADASPSPSAASDKLTTARELIQREKWVAAIEELKQVNDPSSADWNNLMGYSHRKAKVPDYSAAERYYNEALRLDPKHKGALEYSGELYLMLNQLPQAEARLATLATVCTLPCAEYTDLESAIARHKGSSSGDVVAK